jgi:hypothetical protein
MVVFGLKISQNEALFRTRYETLLKNFTTSFELLDQSTDANMLTAARYLRDTDQSSRGSLDLDLQKTLVRQLGLTGVEYIDNRGRFLFSTHYAVKELPNLFSFCADYRSITSNSSNVLKTPVMPSVVDSTLYKYLLIPTQDGRSFRSSTCLRRSNLSISFLVASWRRTPVSSSFSWWHQVGGFWANIDAKENLYNSILLPRRAKRLRRNNGFLPESMQRFKPVVSASRRGLLVGKPIHSFMRFVSKQGHHRRSRQGS